MARINPALIPALQKKLGLGQARIYTLIQEISARNRVPRHLGALLLAGENGLSFQKYASKQDLDDLRGVDRNQNVEINTSATRYKKTMPVGARGRAKNLAPKDNSVFVVHGRDEELRKSMFSFLRALGLRPIEWSQALDQAKGANPNIKNTIETVMAKAQAVLVLFSPDEEARLKEQYCSRDEKRTEGKLAGQPRPNVLFEAGLALGAHSEKTLLVQVGRVRGFTDISGLHIAKLTNDSGRRNDVANRLEKIGCKINRKGEDWYTAGNFDR